MTKAEFLRDDLADGAPLGPPGNQPIL